MNYRDVHSFLAGHTRTFELRDDGARVAICPEWQGRVMTSTCSGDNGPSFGFINRSFIEAGKSDAKFNNFGGEERLWLSPEGGPFSLWFTPGAEQSFANWFTPAALNEGAWPVTESDDRHVVMHNEMEFRNTAGTPFRMDVDREAHLLAGEQYASLFGADAARLINDGRLASVGYETVNRLINRGEPLRKASGLVSIWMLGMFNAGDRTVVIAPYRPGPVDRLGPIVKSDYFGDIPPERLKITPEAVLFMADGHYRAKLGLSPARARPVMGSIDFDLGVLTLVHFTMPDDPTEAHYLNNQWGDQDDPYAGDASNAYNDGPNESGSQLGAFYEIESLSPARPLEAGEALEHRHRTIHLQGEPDVLRPIAQAVLGVDLDKVNGEMF